MCECVLCKCVSEHTVSETVGLRSVCVHLAGRGKALIMAILFILYTYGCLLVSEAS